jgi:hypothetical protein
MNSKELIDRRELLRRTAVLFGGALSAPAVLGVLSGCSTRAEPGWTPAFFSREQIAVVAEVAEIMIPRTDTPGARDVGVPAFIDTMLDNVYSGDDRARYLTGLATFEAQAQQQQGREFLALTAKGRQRFVQQVHDVALHAGPGGEPPHKDRRPFILMTKELTLLGFFTSRAGATAVLQYDPLPGSYQGCLPLAETGNGRTWATETNLPF